MKQMFPRRVWEPTQPVLRFNPETELLESVAQWKSRPVTADDLRRRENFEAAMDAARIRREKIGA